MLTILLFIFVIKYYSELNNSESIALENGVHDEDYDILKIGLWLYIIPPILGFLFPAIYKIYIVPLVMLVYLPGIYYGIKISKILERNYDYVRRLSKKVDHVVWVGYGGMALVLISWILIETSVPLRGI